MRGLKKFPVLVVKIGACTSGDDRPGGGREVVLNEHTRHVVGVVEPVHIFRVIAIALHCAADYPDVPPALTGKGAFAEPRVVKIRFGVRTKLVVVPLSKSRASKRQKTRSARRYPRDDAPVEALGGEVFGRRSSVGSHTPRHRSAAAVFGHRSRGEENRSTRSVLPHEPRPRDSAAVARQICPSVFVDVVPLLEMSAAKEAVAPVSVTVPGQPRDAIGTAPRRSINQQLLFGSVALRLAGNQVDHAAESRSAVQCGRHALDDLDLPQVHRRDLQDTDRSCGTIQREAVSKNLRIASAEPLHAHAGGTKRRRRHLHAKPVRLGEHHRDIAGGHENLFVDLFLRYDLDANGLVFDAPARARGSNDGHFVFE